MAMMDSAPVLLPSPRKSPFHSPYTHEIHSTSSEEEEEEDPYSYGHSPDEAVFDDSQEDSQDASSPHTSDDDISTIPPEPDSRAPSTIYTPHKRRSPFRHPSSVKNMQLETTPPHLVSSSRRSYQLQSPSRNGTPHSHYSNSSRPRSTRSSPSKKPKVKKEHPLVLLHLTLLPLALPYSQSLLETVLPAKKLADCKLLKEKLSASVIQERGVLIPHPKDDYELLEERLLEALELEQGTLSRDGHFLSPEERLPSRAGPRSIARTRYGSEDIPEEDEEEMAGMNDEDDDDTHTEVADVNVCHDCGKHIETLSCDRRWDIRVYAANGLMREGAWSAAWREMERVDVEIKPFISDEAKRELEDRWEEMELLMAAEHKERLLPATEETIHESIEEEEELRPVTAASRTPTPEESRVRLSTERLKEIYGEEAEAKIESLKDEPLDPSYHFDQTDLAPRSASEIPLSTLLYHYVRLLLQDRRNVAIICLSSVVVFMAHQIVRPPQSAGLSMDTRTEPPVVQVPISIVASLPVGEITAASIELNQVDVGVPSHVAGGQIASDTTISLQHFESDASALPLETSVSNVIESYPEETHIIEAKSDEAIAIEAMPPWETKFAIDTDSAPQEDADSTLLDLDEIESHDDE